MKIWDTAGQERFRNLTKGFYKKADGVILVYDLTDSESFEQIEYWKDQIKEHAKATVVIVIVGNKSDMPEERAVGTF